MFERHTRDPRQLENLFLPFSAADQFGLLHGQVLLDLGGGFVGLRFVHFILCMFFQ